MSLDVDLAREQDIEELRRIAQAREIGLEWAVLDDGWQTSEGDWKLNRQKFPRGDADMKAFADTIKAAGLSGVPFTTGILIGIGESAEDRVDSLLAIRELDARFGHIQEVIIQNFRVKPDIPMRHWSEPSRGEMLRTIAVARLVFGTAKTEG